MTTEYEQRKALKTETVETLEYLRSTYSRTPPNRFFEIAVLRALALIIKLMLHQL